MSDLSAFRKTVLQGEILALLHDIGKLHWRFISDAAGNADDGLDVNLSLRHTLLFLCNATWEDLSDLSEDKMKELSTRKKNTLTNKVVLDLWGKQNNLPSLQQALRKTFADAWAEANGTSLTCLGSLIALHHGNGTVRDKVSNKGTEKYPAGELLAMYADTSDSRFSKGPSGKPEKYLLDIAQPQKTALHLAAPQGGVEEGFNKEMDGMPQTWNGYPYLNKEKVEKDEKALAEALDKWASSPSPSDSDWDEKTLIDKRDALLDILKTHTSRHMAETRIPNNDVSLWQHSASTAAIFKALLASYLLSGDWSNLLRNGELAHAQQKLAMLAVRWDDETFLSRSLRSYEIVGRRAKIFELSEEIKKLIENEYCLGNEIYRDHSGICFLVPEKQLWWDKPLNGSQTCRDRIEELFNSDILQGDLTWKLRLRPCGLRLTDMLAIWKVPFDSEEHVLASGPSNPAWAKAWENTAGNQDGNKTTKELQNQVCPRCGLRPVPWAASRTGSSADNIKENRSSLCPQCQDYVDKGQKIAEALQDKDNAGQAKEQKDSNTSQESRKKKRDSYALHAFGDVKSKNVGPFWKMVESSDPQEKTDNRLALVQGVIPLDSLYDGSFFNLLLSPPKEGSLKKLQESISPKWENIHNGAEDDSTREFFANLFVSDRFGTKDDGWSSDAEEGKWQKAWLDNLIFKDESLKDAGDDVRKIITWAARQHPSPSRLARMLEQTRAFMRQAFKTAQNMNIPFVPLTSDAGVFQILVPAGKALGYCAAIARAYEERFGRVRHLLPLQLSASVFYHKAPLYIAMDAARRFRRALNEAEAWTLEAKSPEGSCMRLDWRTKDGRSVTWRVPRLLPNGAEDLWHTWLQPADEKEYPVHLKDLSPGQQYLVRPSIFDFEVLDASTRRYDIRYDPESGRRPHFMMPKTQEGPRPYPLEELEAWTRLAPLFSDKGTQSQRKTALELLARLHADWKTEEAAFEPMARDILKNTINPPADEAQALLNYALDGTLFDLYEWYDFLIYAEGAK